MLLRQIFDPGLAQYSYLIGCPFSRQALVVDPQRDVDRYLEMAAEEGLEIVAVAETHIHADFLSGARELSGRREIQVYLSDEGGENWRYAWGATGDYSEGPRDVVLLRDGDTFSIGSVELRAVHTPGHTPEHLCYLLFDRGGGASTPLGLLSGDFVLVGDLGRPDLLEKAGGVAGSREASARELYRSLEVFTGLDDHLLVWPGHGAGSSCGKSIGAVPVSSVGYEKRTSDALADADLGEGSFVEAILANQPTPPTYFGRMKRENRDGPPLLRRLPQPRRLAAVDLPHLVRHGETVVVDTRPDRSAFMGVHLPGSLHAPFNRSFSTTVGSLVAESTRPIVLLIEQGSLDAAVRNLVRIGYDMVVAYFESGVLEEHLRDGGERSTIREIDFGVAEALRKSGDYLVVDVRDHFEFAQEHIPGAVNAPHVRLPEYLPTRISQGRPLIVHCESGVRSAAASAWLAAQGREVLYVNDDWSERQARGGEVDRREVPPGTSELH